MRQAAAFLVALLRLGLLVLLQLNRAGAGAGGGVAAAGGAVSPGQARDVVAAGVLGFTFGWGAPMGWPPATGAAGRRALCASTPPPSRGILGFDTVYAHQDRRTTRWWACAPPPGCSRRTPGRSWGVLRGRGGPAGARRVAGRAVALVLRPRCCPAALLACQVRRLDLDDPAGCLRLFQLNREAGLLLGLALLAGRW